MCSNGTMANRLSSIYINYANSSKIGHKQICFFLFNNSSTIELFHIVF